MPDTFSRIYTIGSTSTANMQVVTDGTDIFFEDATNDPGSIYKYDVALNSHSKLVDASEFTITGSNFSMIVFASTIYVATIDSAQIGTGNPIVNVYSVNVSTGAVTLVDASFPVSVHADAGGSGVDNTQAVMYSTEDYVVCGYRERRNYPGPPPENAEFISRHSVNGTSWTTSTNSFSEIIELSSTGSVNARASGKDYRTLGIHDRFPVQGTSNVVFLQFDGGTWTKVRGPVASAGNELWEVAADYFWTRDDFGEYTADWVTFPTPTGLQGRMVGLNMPWAVCHDFWDVDHIIYKINTASPPSITEDSRIVGTGLTAAGNPIQVMIRLNDGNTLGFFRAFDASFPNWSIWQRSGSLPATPGAWGGSGSFPDKPPSRKPADVDADGTFLYIALLIGGGVPALFKLSTTLTVDPTVVFNPGAGTDIGVQCGRYDANIVWIGGEFGSGDTLEKSEDAGDTFDIKDAGIFGYVRTFEVGMDSDDRVIIFDSVGNEIYETENSGDSWSLINSNTGFVVNVIKRLRFNLEEIVTGNNSGVVDNVDYSVNSGQNLEDLSFPVSQDVNSLAIG